jgi:hypothetical protein
MVFGAAPRPQRPVIIRTVNVSVTPGRAGNWLRGFDKCTPSIFNLPQFGYENPLKAKDFLALAPEACFGFGSGQK